MFNWKRRRSELQNARSISQPSAAEQGTLVPYDLFGAQLHILGGSVRTIIDAGTHREQTTTQFLKNFPRAHVLAVEAVGENVVAAQAGQATSGDRLELVRAILSDSAGVTELRRNADGRAPQKIDTVTVTDICAARGIESLDILKVDNRGDELKALKGAETMLSRGAIRLVVLNVKFAPFGDVLPTFWYIADYLRRLGYALQGIYEWHHQPRMPAVLKAAEAIFVAPQMQVVPESALPWALLSAVAGTDDGFRLPDRFLCNLRLQEGAAVRLQSSVGGPTSVQDQPIEGSSGIAPIRNVIIDLPAEPYKYSVVLDADRSIIQNLRGIGFVVLEVSIIVIAGRVGILWADENYQPLAATESYASAMPGLQRVLVSVPFMQAHHLVIRSVAEDSTGTTFKVMAASAKVVGDALQEGALGKPDAEAIHLRALTMARAGDLNQAARLFADAATLEPNNVEALTGQGEMLDMIGHSAIARSKYDAARTLRAAGRGGAPDRNFALRRRGRSTTEIAAYTTVLHPAKPRALAYIARGNAFLAEGRADRALADYETALQLKPTAHEITALKGEALAMLGCYMEALEAFDVAIAARPQDAEAISGRAIVQLALGKIDAADADWRRQFNLLPAARASARACVALRLADYEKALAELDQTLEKEPADPYWHLYRLAALCRLKRPAIATGATTDSWPGRLLALHAGKLTGEQLLARADNEYRRSEALFQLGVLAAARDQTEARRLWTEVVTQSRPDLIEHAAARHELARLGS